jgi:hypothetical protein
MSGNRIVYTRMNGTMRVYFSILNVFWCALQTPLSMLRTDIYAFARFFIAPPAGES